MSSPTPTLPSGALGWLVSTTWAAPPMFCLAARTRWASGLSTAVVVTAWFW